MARWTDKTVNPTSQSASLTPAPDGLAQGPSRELCPMKNVGSRSVTARANVQRAAVRGWICLLLATSACDPAGGSPARRPPRSPVVESSAVHAGDTVSVRITDDPWLSARLAVDPDGLVTMPGCGPLAVAGLDPDRIEDKIAACLVSSGAYEERPEVQVTAVDRAGEVALVVGPKRARRSLAFDPGLTLVRALATGLAGPAPRHVVLVRKSISYEIHVEAILEGSEIDEPLERGDEVLIAAEIAIRRGAPLDMRSPTPEPGADGSSGSDPRRGECGELLLDEVALGMLGTGPRHPRVVRVSDAIVDRCSKETVTSSLRDACLRARQERSAAAQSYGPAHPDTRALDAQLGVCPAGATEDLSGPDCASLRAKYESLVASGKSDRHPLTIALRWRLETCH
jgi:hypothetical protein